MIISQLFKVITLAKCVLTILELKWNHRFSGKKTKLNICHHMLTSFTQLQNRSFHVVEKNENFCETCKNETYTCKVFKTIVFLSICQIRKFVTFLLPSSSCLLKLPTVFPSTELLLYGLVTEALFWPFDFLWVSSNEHSRAQVPYQEHFNQSSYLIFRFKNP